MTEKRSILPLNVIDPEGRSAKELLDAAQAARASGRIIESVILGHLALKAALPDETGQALRARTHLLLSELMGEQRYRALERVHARYAFSTEKALDEGAGVALAPFHLRLGRAAAESGDFSVARYHLESALERLESAPDQNRDQIASTLLALAELSLRCANFAQAFDPCGLEHAQEAFARLERVASLLPTVIRSGPQLDIITGLQARALLQLSAHIPEQNRTAASAMLECAEDLTRVRLEKARAEGRDPDLESMGDLMSILRRSGRNAEAMEVAASILDVVERRQRGDPDLTLSMALVSASLGNLDLTRKLCAMAARAEKFSLEEMASTSAEGPSLAFSRLARHRSMICLALLTTSASRDADSARQMLESALVLKAVVREAQEGFWRIVRRQADPDVVRKRATLVELRNRLSTSLMRGEVQGLWNLVWQLEAREEALSVEPRWREFSATSGAARQALENYAASILRGAMPWDAIRAHVDGPEAERDHIAEVARGLAPEAALIEFVRIDDLRIDTGTFTAGAHYWAIVLHADTSCRAIDLGPADSLERAIAAGMQTLLSCDPLVAEPQLAAMRTLYESLWAPVSQELKDAREVFLSPDGALALVPFGALLAPNGRFLIECAPLYLVPTGRDLIGPREQASLPRPSLIVADPDFEFRSESVAGGPSPGVAWFGRVERLVETRTEGEAAREALGTATLLTDERASETALRQASDPRVLHLATHGFFRADVPSLETRGASREDRVAADSAYAMHVRTLSRSGVALSGFNTGGHGPDDDGVLTAFDVTGINLSATELVVLSACDSAKGDVLAGEGVLGLRRAFRLAGARYLLMSLWRLRDKEARRQVQSFYDKYKAGSDPVSALREVQLARIARFRATLGEAPPAMWAAFMIEGVPRASPAASGHERHSPTRHIVASQRPGGDA
jgi:CHAT domain-containing protein